MFLHYIQYEVGHGFRVKFWRDVWCGESSLYVFFPELSRISNDKEAYVANLMKFSNGVLHWDLSFVRDVQD